MGEKKNHHFIIPLNEIAREELKVNEETHRKVLPKSEWGLMQSKDTPPERWPLFLLLFEQLCFCTVFTTRPKDMQTREKYQHRRGTESTLQNSSRQESSSTRRVRRRLCSLQYLCPSLQISINRVQCLMQTTATANRVIFSGTAFPKCASTKTMWGNKVSIAPEG